MIPTPDSYALVASTAEGLTRLTAFDAALLAAGVGNCNLLKVSSILPPRARFSEELVIPEGALLPIAYASMVGDIPGERICAGVGVGIGDSKEHGVIMEFHGLGSQADAEGALRLMVQEAFRIRGRILKETKIAAIDHVIESCGCAFAAVPLWFSPGLQADEDETQGD